MNIFFRTGAQKFMGAQKLLRGHDASASLRHPQMAPEHVVLARTQRSLSVGHTACCAKSAGPLASWFGGCERAGPSVSLSVSHDCGPCKNG